MLKGSCYDPNGIDLEAALAKAFTAAAPEKITPTPGTEDGA